MLKRDIREKMNQKGQIVEVLSSSSVYNRRENLNLTNEVDFLSESQKRPYSLFDGILVGEHHGLGDFTLGQRKGINVGGKKKPLYVIGFDEAENRLFVGEGAAHPGLYAKILAFDKKSLNIESVVELGQNLTVEVKFEFEEKPLFAKLFISENYVFLQFNDFIRTEKVNYKIFINYKNKVLFNIN